MVGMREPFSIKLNKGWHRPEHSRRTPDMKLSGFSVLIRMPMIKFEDFKKLDTPALCLLAPEYYVLASQERKCGASSSGIEGDYHG